MVRIVPLLQKESVDSIDEVNLCLLIPLLIQSQSAVKTPIDRPVGCHLA